MKRDPMPGGTFNSRSLSTRFTYGRTHAGQSMLQRLARAVSGFAKRSFRSRAAAKLSAIQHLDETQLLAHIDGELSKTGRQQVVDHLQSCWSCRSQFRELCARVESYLADRGHQLPDASDDSGDRIRELRQRLAQIQQSLPPL